MGLKTKKKEPSLAALGTSGSVGMSRRVSIAVDGSKYSQYVVDWYLQYIARPNDEVQIVTCFTPVTNADTSDSQRAELTAMDKYLQDDSQRVLNHISALIEKRGIQTHYRVLRGQPKTEIEDAVFEYAPQLLLIGSRGTHPSKRHAFILS